MSSQSAASQPRRPEVLAPVGAPECLPAAVAGGADAVYLGLRHFNARGRAENFRRADLPHHVDYLHRHGVKCYVVMNTLVHDDEYPKALDIARTAHDSGVDALIIQDLGLWSAIGRELPGIERHASTQMTVHHPSQVAALAALGATRVILARELALEEVAACTREARRLGIETEHFVHGALCYAFSGQCLMSNFAGCRSANRGTCAQNCRFDYSLGGPTAGRLAALGPADAPKGIRLAGLAPKNAPSVLPPGGSGEDLLVGGGGDDVDTVLSMKDLALIGQVGRLADMGVASLKIEGRLKGADYVYTTSRVYRAAVDAWAAGRSFDLAQAQELLRDVFSRGHTDAPLAGAYGPASRLHRYAPERDRPADATVLHVDRKGGRIDLRCAAAPRAGQGFAFAHGMHTGGFLVIGVDALGGGAWRCRVRIEEHGPRLPPGLPVFRNSDHQRKREAQAAMAAVAPRPAPAATQAIGLRVELDAEGRLRVEALAEDGRRAEVRSDGAPQPAASAPLAEAMLREKLGALGGTPFHLGTLACALPDGLFLPASELKRLRRDLVAELSAQPLPATPPAPAAPRWAPPEPGVARRRQAGLWVAVGSIAAARAALVAGAARAWLDDPTLDLWGARAPQVERGGVADGALWLRHPAVVRPSPHLAAIGLPVVAGHLGVLAAARAAGLPVIADHALNVFSLGTLAALGGLGAAAAVISLECSGREIARLAARCADPLLPQLAVVVHGRLPAMLTRQDHGLEPGESRVIQAVPRDGGLPYELQRRIGGDTVVWEGRRLCCPGQAAATATLVDGWVLELADLAPAAVGELVAAYLALRDGAVDAEAVEAIAQRHAAHGLFAGHLEQGSRELDLVLERQQELPSA